MNQTLQSMKISKNSLSVTNAKLSGTESKEIYILLRKLRNDYNMIDLKLIDILSNKKIAFSYLDIMDAIKQAYGKLSENTKQREMIFESLLEVIYIEDAKGNKKRIIKN